MARKVTLNLGSKSYSLITDESEEYLHQLAQQVNTRYNAQRRTRLSEFDSAMMALLTVCDEQLKADDYTQTAREQIRLDLHDISVLKSELADLRRELTRREKEISLLRDQLGYRKKD